MAEYGVVSTGGPLHHGQPIASELSELADSFPSPSSGVIDHRLTFETDIGNALAHLAHLTSSPTETSDLSTTAHHCITRRERALLQSISTIPSAVADHTIQHLLDLLASLLLRPCLTLCVARLCRPLLIDLTGRWLLALTDVDRAKRIFSRACTCSGNDVSEVASSATASPKHDLDGRAMAKTDVDTASRRLEQMLLAFSLILPSAPQLSSFATRALTMAEDASLLLHIATASTSIARTTSMVRSLYRLIRLNPSTVTPLLSWTPLYTILTHTDQSIRIYTASILSIVLGMSDGERSIFLRTHLGEASVEGHLSVLRLLEDETDAEQEARLFIQASEVLTSTNPVLITSAHLCAFAVDLASVLLPATRVSIGIQQDNLIFTLTTRRNLHSIALALSLDVPILLEGAPGVGKTALVEQAAQSLGKDGTLLKIHLGDQTDAKVLLGTYICTSTPGSFRWQPGVLTTAVMEGRWILFEDIDLAPLEVVSVLIPLLETGWLFVASRGEKVRAKEGFRVFGTRSVGTNRSVQGQAAGDGLWHKIPVKALDEGEVVEVIDHLYPRLKECGVQSQILAAFTMIEGFYKDKTISGGRTASLRDLIKWCDRVEPRVKDRSDQSGDQMDVDGEVDLPLSVREDLLREAADCFTESMPTKASRDAIVEKIGAQLGVAAHRVQFYCDVHVPNLQASPSAVTVGRVSLSKRPRDALQVTAQRPYAPTPSSLRLLESISVGISQNEPILLVGETGTGKTTVVQYLAHLTNTPLVVINMSQQSDSSDLLGGFKPVDVRVLAVSVLNEFEALFAQTFSVKANVAFLEGVRKGFKGGRWPVVVKGCRMGVKMAQGVFAKLKGELMSDEPVAKKKTKRAYDAHLEGQWQKFAKTLTTFDTTYQKVSASLLFSFIEGALVKAIREGQWVLLDEINLATPETLDCLTGLLASATSSLVLLERGDTEPVVRHPGFRLFGCMNPANDAGKKELSGGLRGRFTEFWVDAPDATFADLVVIIKQYLAAVLPPSAAGEDLCNDIATFYTTVRGYAAQGLMYDGADHRVHYSMRTLARALTFAVGTTIKGTWILRRGVWEGCCMTFGTGLGDKSREKMEFELKSTVGKKVDVHRNRNVKNPDQGEEQRHVGVGGYYLPLGPLARIDTAEESYILTPTVNQNLAHLARAVMSGKYPVLIQGPTSAGKTSMVEYLAKLTGHTCVRVNNHEGTDVAEYVGGWGEAEEGVDGDRGRLVWQEGILVTALRKGHWLILDELNLAPSDVLESLNRLLDDNRELFIPETQTTIRPHPSFMLFATQNPAGTTYGGRKQLSRAFRNRFLEIHFGDIPTPELHVILERRCQIAPSYAKKIVSVYKSLQSTRGRGRVFEGKHGFVTLRDLFRWAGRGCVGYEELAEEGWCLLGERMRTDEDRAIVRDVIEKEMKVKVDVEGMYEKGFETVLAAASTLVGGLIDQLVWTPTTKRLFTLVWKCVSHNEPVLLVGDTGAGKTTVCQVVAGMCGQELRIVNAHQGSEVGDFVGGMRPVRGRDETIDQAWEVVKNLRSSLGMESVDGVELVAALKEVELQITSVGDAAPAETAALLTRATELVARSQTLFFWSDGPLTQALREGSHFLLDEISLADDSVLERLNSVLEPSQFLLLSEKGRAESLSATKGFRFLATMNPGGDYGKKELSPALRNRFCEIWVPGVTGRGELDGLVAKKLSVGGIDGDMSSTASRWMMDFYDWFAARLRKPRDAIVSLRDVLAWVEFVVGLAGRKVMDIEHAFVHGGCMVVVDGIGVNPAFGVVSGVEGIRREVRAALLQICAKSEEKHEFEHGVEVVDHPATFGVHPFFIAKGPTPVKEVQFSFMAPTTLRNLSRVLRALQLIKPILLEGSPGVGKTSLVTTLAHLTGHNLTRINLSEQTDLTDLFGTDLPVEGTGNAGRFAWRDGPFLNAMKKGEWVLLDELNLASQQVLEGLNACLDHRGEVYIPELDRVFQKGTGFRVFAAQNPQGQGGGRKGLPRSFVNRFTSVYVEALSEADVSRIITNIFGAGMEASTIEQMVRFNERMKEETMEKMRFGTRGGPWEFNLRDVVRWVELVKTGGDPRQYLEMMYAQRMRSVPDRVKVRDLFDEVFGASSSELRRPQWWVTEKRVMIGCGQMERKSNRGGPGMHGSVPIDRLHILPSMLPTLETLLKCVEMNYMPILTGPAGSGKTSLVRTLAGLCGVTLKEFSMNPGVDSVELLGGFEQGDTVRRCKAVVDAIGRIVECTVRELIITAQEEGIRIGSRVVTEWDGVVRAFDAESETSTVDSFVDQLEVVVEQLGLDLSGHSLPSFQQVRILTSSYKDAVAHGTQGTFEWVDGTLIKAMEEGHWILLDNVNLCQASVLDRLNPLLESGGVLNVTERGLDASGEVHIVGTRPAFRIFMCLDDRFGEVSRAMRNRGVEVFVDGTMSGTNEDTGRVVGGGSLAAVVEKSLAVPSQVSPPALVGVTEIRNMRMYARLLAERIQRGDRLQDAVTSSMRDVFGQRDVPTLDLSSNEEGRILASVFAAPMLSPQFASGRLILDESRLARVVMDGAYLQYITLQRANTPLRPKLIAAAIKTFIEGATIEDFSLRRSWILLFKRNLRKDDHEARDALENLLAVFGVNDNDWITSLEQIRDRLCVASGIDSTLVQGLPNDLRLVETSSLLKLRQVEEWSSYVTVMRTRALSSRLQKMAHQESQIGSSGVPGCRAAVTVLAASRMHASFRIGETELEHPCVATFWPLVEVLRCAVAGWVFAVDVAAYFDAIESLLDARDRFWACLQAAELPFEDTFVALRRLRKALALCPQYDNDEDASNLRSLVDRAAQQIGLNSFGGAAASLWKHGSVTVLKRTDLFDIERDFAAVNASLNVWNGPMPSQQQPSAGAEPDASTEDIFWGGMGHPAAVADRLVKQSVVEGVATLYYLNEGADAGAAGADQEGDLVTVLADVPKRMMIAVAKTAADNMEDAKVIRAGGIQEGASLVEVVPRVPMMIVNRYADRAATLSGWALVEAAALKAELGVLRKLGGLVVEQAGQHKLRKLVHELTALHTTALEETSRPPLDLEPLQRLIWVCDSSKKDSEAMSSFVKVVLLDGMYRWHRALWSNATAFWAEAMDDEVNAAPLLDCAVLDTLRGTTEIKPTEHRCGGPAILERGVSSRFALRFSMPMDRVPTYAHPAKKEQLLGLVRYLTSERYEAALGDGAADDMGMLTVVLHQFLESHQKAFEPEVYAEIISGARQLREFAQGRVGDAQVVVQEMMKQFSNSRSEIVSSRLRVYLGPGLIALADILSGRGDSAAQRGKFWMCYSIAFLRSYIPEVPIDPASGPAVKLKFMKDDADGVRSEIHVREEIERMLTGNKDNSLIRELLTRVERIEARGKNWTSRVALRPARSQIREILNDLKLLGGHLLSDGAVNGLMQALDGGRNNDVAANQEAHLQDTLAALVVRLETKYPLYRDVLQPVYLAVYQFKYGLRLLAGSNVERANHGTQADVEKLLTAAVRFVDDGRMEGLETVLPRVKGFAGTPVQLQIIFGLLSRMHASIQVRGAVRPDTLGPVHVLFGSLVDAWAEAEQARIDKEKAEADLYKYKERTHDVLNEDEIDEEQFREQFPDFYADFNDVLPSAPADQKAAKTTLEEPREKKEAPAVSVEIAQEIRLLHRGIVDSWIAGASSLLINDTIENSWKKAFKRSYTCAGELLRSCSLCPSQKLDHDGRGGYLFMATEQLRTLTVSSADEHGTPGLSAGARYDFYRDANVAEARRIHEILSALDARLGELLAQWPEHSVLLQLAMLCERITSFSITSPVMKLLTGLEIVIQKCQDWEPYASRDVSLKPHIEAITGLIVRWRKLELRSWRELLEVEDRRSEQAASALWFHLWKVVVGIAVQGTDNTDENLESESIQVLVKDVLAMLDQFCLSSALGEFHTRLDMINVFHRHLCAVGPTVTRSGQGRFRAIASVLHNVYRYYSQFGDHVKATIERMRKPIWKELNGYVQIATWKDVNVYALKESAARSHYHLHKFVKKYRAILDLPVRDAITAFHDDLHSQQGLPSKESHVAVALVKRAAVATAQPPSIVPALSPSSAELFKGAEMVIKLEHLVNRMRKHTQTMMDATREEEQSAAIEEVGSTILERIKDFQEMNSTLEAGSKAAKGQKAVRKKALVDLYKYLAFLGISGRCTQRYIIQRESTFIHTLPKITLAKEWLNGSFAAESVTLWNKADSYFYRVLAKMAKVRDMEVTASPDLSRPEVAKSISYLEYLLHCAIEQRGALAGFMVEYGRLFAIAAQIRKIFIAEDANRVVPSDVAIRLISAQKDLVDEALMMTVQASILVQTHVASTAENADAKAPLEIARTVFMGLKSRLDQDYEAHVSHGAPALALQGILAVATSNIGTVVDLSRNLRMAAQRSGQIAYAFEELDNGITSKVQALQHNMLQLVYDTVTANEDDEAGSTELFHLINDSAIKSVLLSFQSLLPKTIDYVSTATAMDIDNDNDGDEFGLQKDHVAQTHQRITGLLDSKHIGAVFTAFEQLSSNLATHAIHADASSAHRVRAVRRIYPLLEQYLLVVQYRLFEYLLQHKSMLKLAYILCNTFGQLFKNGFCVPREGEDDEGGDEGQGVQDNVDGMGIGEGEGKKDVSDEIENDGQIEGMANDKAPPEPEKRIEDEENGIEKDNDGKMEDVDMEDQDEQDEDEDEGDDPNDVDEEMGELEGDQNVVDEKLWGDEDNEKDEGGNDKDDKVERDAPVQDQGGESEMAAKENGGQDDEEPKSENEKKNEKHKENEPGKEDTDDTPQDDGEREEQVEGDDDVINEDNEEKYEDNHGVDVKPADLPDEKDNALPEEAEEDELALPEDMDLDGDGGDDEGAPEDRGGGADEMDVDPPAADHIDDATEDKLEDAEGMDGDEQETEAGEGKEEEKLEPESLAEQEDQGEVGADAENEGNNIQDSAHGLDEDKQVEENPDGEEQDKDASQASDDQAKMSTEPFGVQGATRQKSAANMQKDASAEDMPDEGEEGAAQNSSLGSENKKQREMKNDTSKEKAGKKDEKADPNPRRSVGDALKKWMSRLKDISDAPEEEKEGETNEDEAERTDKPVGEDSMDFEFVQDDEQAADTQAMADATADQMGEMDQKALADDKEEKEYGNDMEAAEPEKDDDSEAEDASKETEDGEQKSKQKSNKLSGALEVGRDEPEDEAAKQQKGRDQGDKNGYDSDAPEGASEGDDTGVDFNRHHPLDRDDASEDGTGQDNDTPLDSQDFEELRRELEQSVTEWRESGQDAEEAHELWRNYTSLTRDLSFALCEQLRLILEPTLATKLKGDYRTGKRLNMRKIIPYIASQFKKDKIWLRRTKPSKRTYQIMIAIDDSRSMAESRSVQLAYESLAVITKALTQLEAGDVSVMSFGQDVRLLHPFDRPFSDEAGADVIRRFTFAQDRTNVRQLMDTAMGVLEHARLEGAGGGGPGATDLWQLQLVLSDGICEDHEMVRSLVRRAAEQRIMVVFIVLDNRGDKDSITKMTNVTYGSDPVTGKPLLQMNKYMDTFPFDYYVICKDIGALPEVLADTLRQYFMFVS